MKIQAFKTDIHGFIVEIQIVDSKEKTELITVQPPDGLYKAKWTGEKWIEGLREEELEEIEYRQYLESLKPSDEDIKKAQLELLMLDLLIEMEVL